MPEKRAPLPDGIYLGLDEDIYHADPALGSSDLRNLLKGGNVYWWGSSHNPLKKPEKLTDAKIFGRAMHKLLLEGSANFNEIYIRRPEDDEDATSADKSAITKAFKKKLLAHQFMLKAPEYDFICGVKNIIDTDPDLKGCLDNALTEVSIFWTRKDGTRLKGRMDVLKLRGYGDIKSIANERDHELGFACRQAITSWRYDIQIEHYNEGRRQLPLLWPDVFVGTTHFLDVKVDDPAPLQHAFDFLSEIVAQKDYAAQLVFVPKLGNDNAGTKAPDAWSTVISPQNPGLKIARDDIETALMIYRDNVKAYGLGKPWMPRRTVSELSWEELPWTLSRRVVA